MTEKKQAVAYWAHGAGLALEVLTVNYEIEDTLTVRWSGESGELEVPILYTAGDEEEDDAAGRAYIDAYGMYWYLDECMRVDIMQAAPKGWTEIES